MKGLKGKQVTVSWDRKKDCKVETDENGNVGFLPTGSESTYEENEEKLQGHNQPILWINCILLAFLHCGVVYTFFVFPFRNATLTVIWGFVVGGVGGFGITAGVHRFYAHKSYKAKLPLQIILLLCYSIAGQNDVYQWVRDHRLHHKFSDTDADPHNAKRGLFFSHVGWLLRKKHPEVKRKGKLVDMSDITSDPLVMFHVRYFLFFKMLLCFILPVVIPVYCWNEAWKFAFYSQVFVRYALNLNFTWSVNSLAHFYGIKPYDRSIRPSQNMAVSLMAMGEGFHNYHHIFPWDYKTAELGNYFFNITTLWLDFFAKIGWAYDLKQPSPQLIKSIMLKRGDGSHPSMRETKCEEK